MIINAYCSLIPFQPLNAGDTMPKSKPAIVVATMLLLGSSLTTLLPITAHAAVDLGSVVIAQEGWRYNLTIMREQAKTIPDKATQYQYYLTKNNVTDEYIAAYAAAVAARFDGSPVVPPVVPPVSPPEPTGSPGALPPPPFVPDPILGGIEILNAGLRFNLTQLKKLGQYSPAKQEQYIYYRDRNHFTDAYVDAYAAAVAAKFDPDDVGNNIQVVKKSDFTIYHGFRYVNLPTLANCGFSEDIRILYNEELFSTTNRTQPDINRLKTRVVPDLLKRDVSYVIIDIEHWDPVNEMDKLITVIRTLKDGVRAGGNTKMKFGFYMLMPQRNFLAPVTQADHPERYADWLSMNDTMRRLAAEVDAVFPSLYTTSENRDDWLTFARANIIEARKYGKKVIPVLWPQYHDTTPGIGTTYLPIKYWEMQLKEIYNTADELVIWGSVAFQSKGWDTWDKTREWWASTRSFGKDFSDVPQVGKCDE